MNIGHLNHLSTRLTLATYALVGAGTIQERLAEAWREGFARLAKKDIPPELGKLYDQLAVEFKRIGKLPDTADVSEGLLRLSDEDASAITEDIVLLALECAKLQGANYGQNARYR